MFESNLRPLAAHIANTRSGSRSHCMTSYGAYEITKAMNGSISRRVSENAARKYGVKTWVSQPQASRRKSKLKATRPQSYGAPEVDISRDVRARHVLGIFQCARGHVVSEVRPKESGLPWCRAELPARHRSFNAGRELIEEGDQVAASSGKLPLTHNRTSPLQPRPPSLCR